MALARNRRPQRHVDYWPGFVDALTTLLLAIMFLLTVFVLGQFLLSRDVDSKDTALARLNSQIQELTQLLSLEKATRRTCRIRLPICRPPYPGQRASVPACKLC